MSTIKLQILLKRAMRPDELDRVERLLAKLGAEVTARGAVTLSAIISRDHYEKLFARPFEGHAGFASGPGLGATLPVPAELRDDIDTISETPRHLPMKK